MKLLDEILELGNIHAVPFNQHLPSSNFPSIAPPSKVPQKDFIV